MVSRGRGQVAKRCGHGGSHEESRHPARGEASDRSGRVDLFLH
jgi:hypothetical protein